MAQAMAEAKAPTFDEALMAAKRDMARPSKDASNPHFKSRYSSLPNVLDAIEPPLAAHGVRLGFDTERAEGSTYLMTVLSYPATGEERRLGRVPLIGMADMQKAGSAITYAQRYSVSLVFALPADDDDDGNLASKIRVAPVPPVEERRRFMAETGEILARASGDAINEIKRDMAHAYPDWDTCTTDRWERIVAELNEAAVAAQTKGR